MNINNLAKKLNINLNINSSAKKLWWWINNNFFVVYSFNQQMLNIDDWLGCSFKVWLCSFTCSVTYDMRLRLPSFMYHVICNLRLNLWPAIKIMFVYVSRDLRPVAQSIFFFWFLVAVFSGNFNLSATVRATSKRTITCYLRLATKRMSQITRQQNEQQHVVACCRSRDK